MARVLIIEDNPVNLQLMGYLLRAYGHTVMEAVDGDSGLRLAEQIPDLILCDIQLPGMDGCEIARYLKSHPALRAIPLIAVTALAMVGDRDRVLAAGFEGYFTKPIEPETFVLQLEPFLQAVSHEAPAQPAPASNDVRESGVLPDKGAGSGPRVLVVDNLPVHLTLARSILEPFGYRVSTAAGVAEGLAAVRNHEFDLVLSDVCMTDGMGHDFLRAVRNDPAVRDIPVMFLTSTLLEVEDRNEALALGAARYLVRPIEPEKLLAEIEACLDERKSPGGDHPDHR